MLVLELYKTTYIHAKHSTFYDIALIDILVKRSPMLSMLTLTEIKFAGMLSERLH